jgi:glycosyltransferase involved in cell wall biosynthesis
MSEEQPLVSIGLPIFNGERFVQRALVSLLAQDYLNFELVISDNASSDETANICQTAQTQDSRVRYYRNETNIGMFANFQRVLDLARGEYFMFAAHDDLWEPAFIRLMQAELENHPDAGVAMSAMNVVGEDGRLIKPVRLDLYDKSPNELGYLGLLLRVLTIWGKGTKSHHYYFYGLFRREILIHLMRYFIDTMFGDRIFIALTSLVVHFRYVDQVLYSKTRHSSDQFDRHPGESFTAVSKSMLKLFKIPFQLASMIWRCDLVPLARKLYIPLAVLGMSKVVILWTIKQQARQPRMRKNK